MYTEDNEVKYDKLKSDETRLLYLLNDNIRSLFDVLHEIRDTMDYNSGSLREEMRASFRNDWDKNLVDAVYNSNFGRKKETKIAR